MGFKQNMLAERLDLSNNYLSSIERGKEKPSLEVIVNICNALQVTPDYLLMGNMYSNNVPQNIADGLRLCTKEDLSLLSVLIDHLVERQSQKWNMTISRKCAIIFSKGRVAAYANCFL